MDPAAALRTAISIAKQATSWAGRFLQGLGSNQGTGELTGKKLPIDIGRTQLTSQDTCRTFPASAAILAVRSPGALCAILNREACFASILSRCQSGCMYAHCHMHAQSHSQAHTHTHPHPPKPKNSHPHPHNHGTT